MTLKSHQQKALSAFQAMENLEGNLVGHPLIIIYDGN